MQKSSPSLTMTCVKVVYCVRMNAPRMHSALKRRLGDAAQITHRGMQLRPGGARLADVDYIPAFPITPQTEIIELLAQWTAAGTMPARFVSLDSEHSMFSAAGAAAATGGACVYGHL